MSQIRISRGLLAAVLSTAFCLAAAISPRPALALYLPMGVPELSRAADSVVVATAGGGRAHSEGTAPVGRHARIVTEVPLHVGRVLLGDRPSDFVLSVPGGRVGDLEMRVSDTPSFANGERFVLFLDADGRIVGGEQGKVAVEGDRVPAFGMTLNQLRDAIAAARVGGAGAGFGSALGANASGVAGGSAPGASALGGVIGAGSWTAALAGPSAVPASGAALASVEGATVSAALGAPVISAISPAKAIAGVQRVTITGSGFGSAMGTVQFPNGLTINGSPMNAQVIVSWSDTSIVVEVPQYACSGNVSVTDSTGVVSAAFYYDTSFSTSGVAFASTSLPVRYRINENTADMTGEAAQMLAAFDTWNQAGSKFGLAYDGATTFTAAPLPTSTDGKNTIYFASGFGSGALAMNQSWWENVGGNVYATESDIAINDSLPWGATSFYASSTNYACDVQTVVLHELGHTVGIDDQYPNYGRVMGAYTYTNRRVLTADEIAGALYLYGAAAPAPTVTVTSPSHPVSTQYYSASSATFSLTPSSSATAYSWVLDSSPDTVPDGVADSTTASVTLPVPEGESWFHVRASNGVFGAATHYRVRSDRTAPTGSVQIGGPGVTYVRDAAVSIDATLTDALSGVATMRTGIGSNLSAWDTYASHAAVTLPSEGAYAVKADYRDAAGNVLNAQRTLTYDVTAPITTSDAQATYTGTATIKLSADDAVSGVATTYVSLDGGPSAAYAGPVTVTAIGTHTLRFHSIDAAGNVEGDREASFEVTASPEPPAGPGVATRIDGADRWAVAATAAEKAFPGWTGITDVVVASGEDRAAADPLSAAGLAGAYDAPVLLVNSALNKGQVPGATEAALSAIRAENGGHVRIHVVGGTKSVPGAVYSRLATLAGSGGSIERLTGSDRYALSVAIANRVATVVGIANVPGVLVANGESSSAYFDALAASPAAYATHRPLLIVRAASVPDGVLGALNTTFAGKPRVAVNSPALLSAGAAASAGASERMAGSAERTAAAVQIAEFSVARGWLATSTAGVVNKLPDALTAGSALGRLGGPVLYTDAAPLAPATSTWLAARKPRTVYVAGGALSVAPSTLAQVAHLLQ